MQRLELKHRGKSLGAAQFVPDHIGGDLGCKCEGKSHRGEDSSGGRLRVNDPSQARLSV